MAEVWKPKDPSLLRSWLEAVLLEASDSLNDWEKNFINSIEERLDKGFRLSESQEQKLEQIYAEHTS